MTVTTWWQAAARHPDRTAAVALAALVAFLFGPALLGQRVFFQRDILPYWYPHIENAVMAVSQGVWPTWTPYVAFGRPLLADPSVQLLYPPSWLNLLIPPAAYYTLFAAVHGWGAGFGLYVLGRSCGLAPLAAGVAGALWLASGPLLSAVNLFHHFAGAAWMPWVLLMGRRALDRPTLASAVTLGAVAGGQALAGSADMCLFTGLAGTVHAAGYLYDGPGRLRGRLVTCARVALVAAVFAALVAAVQWLPAAALLRGGVRGAHGLATTTSWSVHPASLADMFVPGLVADLPVTAARRAVLFDGRRPFLVSLYVGIASLPLVALAAAGKAHPLRRWGLVALAIFLVAALGRHTPAAVVFAVPPLSLLRYPTKFMVPAALFWALLAGRGLQVWLEEWSEGTRRRAARIAVSGSILVVGLLAAAAWTFRTPLAPLADWTGSAGGAGRVAAGKLALAAVTLGAASVLFGLRAGRARAAAWLTAAYCVLTVADVAAAGRVVNALAVPALVRYRPPAVDAIVSDSEVPRLHVRQESVDQLNDWLVKGPRGWDSLEGWVVGMHDLLVPPIGARWRISGSYDGDFTGLAQPALSVFSQLLPALAHDPFAVKLLRIGGVTHVTSLQELPYAGLEPRGAFASVFTRPVRLHRVPDPLPRVYVVGGARTAATDDQAMVVMADPRFDPRREVILPATAAVHPAPAGFSGAVRVTAARMDGLAAELDLNAPGWLVVVEAWDRGWKARLDGRAVEVLRANALFRAVPLPAGRHLVEMGYHPPGLAAGLLLTAFAVALGLSVVAAERRKARRN